MDKSTLGKIITRYQKKHGVTQKIVHEGIGSQASYQRVDYVDRDVDFIIQETMLARVGLSAESFEIVLGDEEYDEWMLRMEIRAAAVTKDASVVEEKISLYRQEHAQKHILHEQFCLYYEMKLAQWRGEKADVIGDLAERALQLTKRVDDMPNPRLNLYTPMEMDLLLTLVQLQYGFWNNKWNGLPCLQKIIEYAREYYTIEKREDIEGRARLQQIERLWQYESRETLLPYIDETIACFSGATGISRLGEARFIKAKLLWKEHEEAEDEELQRKLSMRECMMAYSIFQALHRNDKLKEIEDFCEGELQWHITTQI